MYSELYEIYRLNVGVEIKYARWQSVLTRICIEASANFRSDYATLFSRLLAVCQSLNIDHRPADRFRRNARLVLQKKRLPTKEEEKADLADLCHFVSQVTKSQIPDFLPQRIRPFSTEGTEKTVERQDLRGVLTEITDRKIFKCRLETIYGEYKVILRHYEDAESNFTATLYVGANVMLKDAEVQRGHSDVLMASMVILEPDYLIDVSTLTASIKPYGRSPLNYLLNILAPKTTNRHNMLGNLANQFLDDCVNHISDKPTKRESYRKNYAQYVLDYACLDDAEIDLDFFAEADRHYEHIHSVVSERFQANDVHIVRQNVLIEPSFVSLTLGLRGRFDLMTSDFHCILELKSGKCEEQYRTPIGPKEDHLLQMTLYGEMLRTNLSIDWNQLKTFLFYSRYPLLYNERPSARAIRDAMALRNSIIYLIHELMRNGISSVLPKLCPEYLNQNKLEGTYYDRYLRPQIEGLTAPLQALNGDPLLYAYFSAYLTFLQRELFLSKTSDNRVDSLRGFASSWTADLMAKQLAGNILTGLTIIEMVSDDDGSVTGVTFRIPPHDETFVPNFSIGEMIQCYETDSPEDNVAVHQLIKGVVSQLTERDVTITLSYKQCNYGLFKTERCYSLEHDSSDVPALQQMRNLYALLTTTQDRRNLILGRRRPQMDKTISLSGEYPESVHHIILAAKQAKDYYLLVGPPGTGKTNVALRSMVEEFLHMREAASCKANRSLLITAYTNRAVDEICGMLEGLCQKYSTLDYLRIGAKATCAGLYHDRLLCKRAENLPRRTDARRMLDQIPIVVGTVLTLTNQQILFTRKHFEAAIVDEASQLLEPQILGLMCAQHKGHVAIDKFIFIGDHKQLPAVVALPDAQTEVKESILEKICITNLRNSLFQRLNAYENKIGCRDFIGVLNRQGRMHPDISDFVNRHFYNNILQPVPLPHQQESLKWCVFDNQIERFVGTHRLGFIVVRQQKQIENLRANRPEAVAVCQLIRAICALYKNHDLTFNPAQSIGVIVPFRNQIATIRNILQKQRISQANEITVDTVECYQGSQRDYIIYSTTISQGYQLGILSNPQQVGNVFIDRKLNVAITRARKHFFMVGDPEVLSHSSIYKALIDASATFTI